MAQQDYTTIDLPYDSNMQRSSGDVNSMATGSTTIDSAGNLNVGTGDTGASSGEANTTLSTTSAQINTPAQTKPDALSGTSISNIFLDSWIKSTNYAPKARGFLIDGPSGYIECLNLYAKNAIIDGAINALSGTIANFVIGTNTISATNLVLTSGAANAANISVGSGSNVAGLNAVDLIGDIAIWAGDTFANRATAPFHVTAGGIVTGSNINITGGSVSGASLSSIPNSTSTDISLLEKTHNLVFSVTNATTIAWALGTITLSNGRTFSILAGNTGVMSALTYIYLDPAVSSTVLQTTTTASTAMGANKMLIGMAKNNTVTATFIPYGSGTALIDGADLGALSIISTNLAAGAVTSAKGNLALRGWTQTSAFTITGATQVNWGVGTFTASDGTAYSIGASNTGVMSAKTFIYLDIGVSTTAYQITTTAATAVGDGKVLIAIAQNNTTEAIFTLLNSNSANIDASNIVTGSITANEIAASTITGAKIAATTIAASNIVANTITASQIAANTITASQIAANTITASQIATGTITANEIAALTITAANIAASTITSAKMNVSQLSAITADLGSITAGTITGGTIQTAASGARVVLGTTGIKGYNSTPTQTSQILNDGSGWFGSTSGLVWDTTGTIVTVNESPISNNTTYGDGSDGDVTISADATLTSDMFYNNLTIATTKTLNPGGYRIFVKGTLTFQGTGKIACNGGIGGDGTAPAGLGAGSGGSAGTAANPAGSLPSSFPGKGGSGGGGTGGGNAGNGLTGDSAAKGVGIAGVAGGHGGWVGAGTGGDVGAAGSITGTIYNKINNSISAYGLFDINGGLAQFTLSAGSGSGGGGGGSQNNGGGSGGGGSGAPGGIIWVAARKIVTVDSTVYLQATGGHGGNAGALGSGGGIGGGGAGGSGGVVVLIYSLKTGTGTIDVSGGAKGTTGSGGGSSGQTDGTDGSTGKTYTFIV